MQADIIFWISAMLLAAVFVISCYGIARARRERYLRLEVVCAGSVDNAYPHEVRVRKSKENDAADLDPGLRRYVVKGNSMQYANINADDIVYVRNDALKDIRGNLPKITMLEFVPAAPGRARYKIRRTWAVLDGGISDDAFCASLHEITCSAAFLELRNLMGRRCPADEELIRDAYEGFLRFKELNGYGREGEFLLSTTFRTERNRLEFSVHPSSAMRGVVTLVSRRREEA